MATTAPPAALAAPLYKEFPPSPKFTAHIECFWQHRCDQPVRNYRVLPDGCSDIIFEQPARNYGGLALVGTMTRAQAFDIPAHHSTFGVRFRPAMAARLLRLPGGLSVDQSIALADAWKSAAVRDLLEQLAEANSPRDAIARLEAALGDPAPLDPIERAIAWLCESRGQISIEALADSAAVSPRQFRRLCLERTGLSPKRLARVLRFSSAAAPTPSLRRVRADIALDCGYYDQAHLINEFRELAGVSPSQFATLVVSPIG